MLKDRSFGPTKKLPISDSGLQDNQTTGETKTACTLLVPSMVTHGMMCLAITATTLLVLQVDCIIIHIIC